MRHKKISIRDVAKLAGTSVGSASRVINGAPNVADDIREKVNQAILTLSYKPNYAAQTLRSRNTKTIGCMFSDVTNPLYARAFRALEARLFEYGYMLLLANGLNDPEREVRILNMFEARSMDGVIIAPGNERNERVVTAVESLSMPIVVYDRDMTIKSDAVLYDHASAIKMAVNHLLGFGHTRIALILWQARSRAVRLRIEGYRQAFKERNLPEPDLVILGSTPTSSAYASVTELLRRENAPTAFIAQGTQTLSSTLGAISEFGLKIPQDISVIGIGDTDFANFYNPPLTVLQTPVQAVADTACTMLIDRIQSRSDQQEYEPRSSLFKYMLIERQSCGSPSL